MLVAQHVGGPVLSQDAAGKSCHEYGGADEGSVREFLVIADRSDAPNPCFAMMKHPVLQNGFRGHVKGEGGGSKTVNDKPFTASTNSWGLPVLA